MLTKEEELEYQELNKEFGGALSSEEQAELAALEKEFGTGAGDMLLSGTSDVQTPATDPNLQGMPESPQIEAQELTAPFSSEAMGMFDAAIAQEEESLRAREDSKEVEKLMYKLRGMLGKDSVLSDMINRTLSTNNPEADQIKRDEGTVQSPFGDHTSYKDHLGNLTGGHGHLLTASEKKKYPTGAKIPFEVVDQWFKQDMDEAEEDVEKLFPVKMPDEVRAILTNMSFNLGGKRLKGFKKLIKAVKEGDYNKAADEMIDSTWYHQVGNRSKRLVERMRAMHNES